MKKLNSRTWLSFILIGLSGQLAWTLENMYFNVYLYNTVTTDPNYIALMVAASAAVATLTTLFMGALSDKLAKRKFFICLGYILWGIITASFGFVNVANVSALSSAASAVMLTAVLIVVMDCVMTFFGSSANDAAFNAFVTDVTDVSNRAKAESVLATLPLISMLLVFGLLDPLTQRGEWSKFFLIVGAFVTFCGIAGIFVLKEPKLEKRSEPYFANIIYGFKPSVIKQNGLLYTALCALCVFSICVQVFFPYLIIYMQNYLKIASYAITLGVVLIVASVVSVVSGGFIDKKGKKSCIIPACVLMFVGLIAMYFARSSFAVIAAGCVMMSGYMLVSAILSAFVRDYTPEGKAGLFQGIRMIFAVLLPMIIGPYIGAAVIKNSAETYIELGVVKSVPTPAIFIASALVLVLCLIPSLSLIKRDGKEKRS